MLRDPRARVRRPHERRRGVRRLFLRDVLRGEQLDRGRFRLLHERRRVRFLGRLLRGGFGFRRDSDAAK